MARDALMANAVEVEVWGFFTTHHRMQTEAGTLGEFIFPAFSAGGVFYAADGRELVVERTSWWRGWHELRENEVVLGAARPQSFWRHTMSVGFRGAMYELAPVSFWSRGWHLIDEAGTVLLEVQPRGIFRRGAYLSVLAPANADLLIFAYYLVNVRWQEHAAATGAAAAES